MTSNVTTLNIPRRSFTKPHVWGVTLHDYHNDLQQSRSDWSKALTDLHQAHIDVAAVVDRQPNSPEILYRRRRLGRIFVAAATVQLAHDLSPLADIFDAARYVPLGVIGAGVLIYSHHNSPKLLAVRKDIAREDHVKAHRKIEQLRALHGEEDFIRSSFLLAFNDATHILEHPSSKRTAKKPLEIFDERIAELLKHYEHVQPQDLFEVCDAFAQIADVVRNSLESIRKDIAAIDQVNPSRREAHRRGIYLEYVNHFQSTYGVLCGKSNELRNTQLGVLSIVPTPRTLPCLVSR